MGKSTEGGDTARTKMANRKTLLRASESETSEIAQSLLEMMKSRPAQQESIV